MELWLHFECQLLSFLTSRLNEVLIENSSLNIKIKTMLIDLIGYDRFEIMVNQYILQQKGNVSGEFIKSVIIEEI